MKLSISLPAEEVGFLDPYARSQGIKSWSGVIQTALRVLRTSELADDYASAWAEWDEATFAACIPSRSGWRPAIAVAARLESPSGTDPRGRR